MRKSDFPLYHYRATLHSVTDGDTFRCEIDLGDGSSRPKRRIRIIGYNAPDKTQPGWLTATSALRALLPTREREIYLKTEKDAESWERLLAFVYVPSTDDDEDLIEVAEVMIRLGHHVERA